MSRVQASRGDATRKKIVDAAEQLMAVNGVDAVSLNEIVKAAGQRNPSALSYHFGNKAGILQAVFDKHTPAIEERRQLMLNSFGAEPSIEEVAQALALPLVEELDNPDGGQNYLKLIASMQYHSVGPQAPSDKRHNSPLASLSILLRKHSSKVSPIEHELRATMIRNGLLHNLADYCRRIQNTPECDKEYRPIFITNLTKSLVAILSMPAGEKSSLVEGKEI